MMEGPKKWTCFADAYEDGARVCVRMIKDMMQFGATFEEIEPALLESINENSKKLRKIESS